MEQKQPLGQKQPQSTRKTDRSILFFVVAAVLLIAILAIVFNLKKRNHETAFYDTDAFFVAESNAEDTKYALFNKDGKRLTDFNIASYGTFINNYAFICESDDRCGVIDHNGKMSIDYGKYDSFEKLSDGFYLARKGNETSILTGSGSQMTKDFDDVIIEDDAPLIIAQKTDNQYELYNAFGHRLLSFTSDEEPTIDGYEKQYATVNYPGHIALVDYRHLDNIDEYSSSRRYMVSYISNDEQKLILADSLIDDEENSDDVHFAVYDDKIFYEINDECARVSVDDDELGGNYFTCETKDGISRLIYRGAINHDFDLDDENLVIYDGSHYARYDEEKEEVAIYIDGNQAKTIKASAPVTLTIDSYLVYDYDRSRVSLISADGNEVFSFTGSFLSWANGIDKNNNVIMYNYGDGSTPYSVVNRDGSPLSAQYDSIKRRGFFYTAYLREDGKTYILDSHGKRLTPNGYDFIEILEDKSIIFGHDEEGKSDYINASDGTVVAQFDGSISYQDEGYFIVENDEAGNVKYYTLAGEQFYEREI